MNILQINNYHYPRGGADSIYLKTIELLEAHGHKCIIFSMQDEKNIPCATSEYFMPFMDLNAEHSIMSQLKIAGTILYSFEARKRLSRLLDKYPVDIAHLHNIYHALSPSIIDELKKRKIPVVMTLHDPKLVCGSHNVYVNGKPCDACTGGKHYMAVMKRCVKDSFAKSMLIALEMYLHHNILHIYDKVDIFIFPSLFFQNKFREMGFEKESVHLPSFVDIGKLLEFDPQSDSKESSNCPYIIYVGRLLEDKGLFILLEAAKLLSNKKNQIGIKLSGTGPIGEQLHEKVRVEKIDNIKFLGYLEYEDLCSEMKNSVAVVLPAINYENNPVSIIEAFALGKPVIGSRLGGIPELVKDKERGLTFKAGDPEELSTRIKHLVENPEKAEKMGKSAKAYIKQELDAEKYYQRLMEIYMSAIQKKPLKNK